MARISQPNSFSPDYSYFKIATPTLKCQNPPQNSGKPQTLECHVRADILGKKKTPMNVSLKQFEIPQSFELGKVVK